MSLNALSFPSSCMGDGPLFSSVYFFCLYSPRFIDMKLMLGLIEFELADK